MLKEGLRQYLKNNINFVLLVLLGVASWSVTMVKSQIEYSFGLGFWGPNGHDGIWHLALANRLSRLSLEMPSFAGATLSNYHIGYDLLLGLLSRVTTIPIGTLYFQILPPLIALSIGLLTYKLVLDWKANKAKAIWAVFFVYFGGSFGWIVTLIRNQGLGGESMFWAQQQISTLINPPFAFSLLLLLAGLIFVLKMEKEKSWVYMLCSAICFGILIEIKVYAGVLAILGLLVAGTYQLFRGKGFGLLTVFLIALAISGLLYFFFNRGSGSLIVFQPFWFLETMMAVSDRLGWPRFYSAMMSYKSGQIYVKEVLAYGAALAIFIIGNLGTRVLAIKTIFRPGGKEGFLHIFVLTAIAAGIVAPMLFVQKGTPWNTIQFFYYSLFFLGILAGIAVGDILGRFKLTFFAILIVLFTIPTTIGTLSQYLPSRPPARLPKEEIEALKFLRSQPDGVVLTYPFDKYQADLAVAFPPRPLYLYESCAYVSAYSDKVTFLEDEVNLDITGFDWRVRRNEVERFLNSLNQSEVRGFLKDNNIAYIYWIKGQRARLGETQLGIERIFENRAVDIYKVTLQAD